MMRVLLLADGSATLGAGHQVRCGALAAALRQRGVEAVAACRDLPGSPHAWAWAGGAVDLLPASLSPGQALAAAVERAAPDLAVIDHYGLAAPDWAGLGVPVAAIDDLPGRDLAGAAWAVNASPGAVPADYPRLAALAGPRFALLRPGFTRLAGLRRDGPVLVLAGGLDATGAGPRLVEAVLAAGLPVATAGGTRHPRAAHRGPLDAVGMAALLAECRAAVVSASTVALEAIARGLPVVAVRTAGNQRLVAEGLAAAGVAVLDPDDLGGLPAALAAARPCGDALGLDGLGAGRVAERLAETVAGAAVAMLRPARWDDADRLLAWAGDPATRAASFNPGTITRPEHLAWLARILGDPERRLFIGRAEGRPVGTVRLDRADGTATVSIAVAPEARGQGHGRTLLAALVAWARATRFAPRLDALVRLDNPASLALFTRGGFASIGPETVHGHPARRFRHDLAQ